jgi:hypothetical protein
MKKYLGMVIAVVAILTIGTVGATILKANDPSASKTPLVGTLGGGCGGHGHGCHNNTNLTEITGVLVYDGTNFMIDTTFLNFGCYNYINTTISPYDFDGDGTVETVLNELLGLVGTSITVEGRMNCQNTRLMVIYINGILYRECYLTISSK